MGIFTFTKKLFFWPIIIFLFAFIIFFFIYFVNSYQNNLTYAPKELETNLLVERFFNSEDCFAYQDPVKKVVLNSLDLEKFNKEQLEKCYPVVTTKDYNFQFKIPSLNLSLETEKFYFHIKGTIIKEILLFNQGQSQNEKIYIYFQEKI